MSNETCPHCGAEHWDFDDEGNEGFYCGTYITEDNNVLRFGEKCYERQFEQQAAEIEMFQLCN